MKSIYCRFVEEWTKKRSLALATIIDAQGSSPQVPGASALFSRENLLSGTVGGGMLEAEIQSRAIGTLKSRESLLLNRDLSGEMSSQNDMICGGAVSVLIDACPDTHVPVFQSLCEAIRNRKSGVLVTGLKKEGKEKVSLSRQWMEKSKIFGPEAEERIPCCRDEIKNSFATGKPARLFLNEGKAWEFYRADQLFLEPVFPFCQLLIAGAGHVGRAVTYLGSRLDFEVTVIDDRPEFANKQNVPEADSLLVAEISEAVRNFPITRDTFIVIVTRGHSHDADTLRACIQTEAAYIGMIGSASKIKLVRQTFLEKGWATPEQFDRIYTPIGLEIQSKTVEEIAVSIAAQLVLVRNQVQSRRNESS